MYVRAQALSISPRGTLILGEPNYIWTNVGSERDTVTHIADSVLGVVIKPDGAVGFVSSPFPRRVLAPQAAALPDGAWLVVFAEVAAPTDERIVQRPQALWEGVYDGDAWTELHRIPVPPSLMLDAGDDFSLSVNGREAAVALVVNPADGSLPPRQVLLARRHAQGWTTSLVRAFGSKRYQEPYAVDELSLQPWSDHGVALVVMRFDATLPLKVAGFGSLFLYTQASQWQERRIVETVDRSSVMQFTASLRPEENVVTWIDGATVVAYAGSVSGPLKEVVVDSAVARIDSRLTRLSNGMPLWITQHWRSRKLSFDTTAELNFFTMRDDSVRLSGTLPSPFMWFQGAVRSGDKTLTLAGLAPVFSGRDTVVDTGILQVRADCDGRHRRGMTSATGRGKAVVGLEGEGR